MRRNVTFGKKKKNMKILQNPWILQVQRASLFVAALQMENWFHPSTYKIEYACFFSL